MTDIAIRVGFEVEFSKKTSFLDVSASDLKNCQIPPSNSKNSSRTDIFKMAENLRFFSFGPGFEGYDLMKSTLQYVEISPQNVIYKWTETLQRHTQLDPFVGRTI